MRFFHDRRTLYLIVGLLIISPIFGVILADMVGYHEPLDVAAEKLGLEELEFNWTPLYDYSVPGLPAEVGYIVAGIIGILVIWGICYLVAKLMEKRESGA